MGYSIIEDEIAGTIEYGLACGKIEVPQITSSRADIEALAALLNGPTDVNRVLLEDSMILVVVIR